MQKSMTRIIGEGTFLTLANTFVVKAIGLVTVFLILRTLSVYEYGVAELAITAVGFLGIFQLPGLASVVLADIGVEKGKGNLPAAKGLYLSYLRLSAIMAAIAFLGVFFGADLIQQFYPEHIASYFRILAFTFPLSVIGAAYGTVFVLNYRYLEQSLNSFYQELFKLVIILISFNYFGLKVEAILYGMVIGQALTFVVQYPAFRKAYREFGQISEKRMSMWKTLYEHGKWSIFSSYLGNFGNSLRTWLIKIFFGTEVVALYAVAAGLMGHTTALVPVGNVVTPIIPQQMADKERFKRIISKAIKYQVLGFAFVILVAFFLFPPIIVYLFPKYVSAMPLYRIMLFGLIPVGVSTVFTAVFFAYKAQKNLFFAVLFKTFLFAVTIPLFAPLGPIGAAYSYVAVLILYTIERYRIIKKLVPAYRISLHDLFTVDELDRIILEKLRAAVQRLIPFKKRI